MVEKQPSLFFWGIRLDEPVTTATDLLISFVCFYAFFKLSRIARKQPLDQYLRFYFLSMGIATAIGGIIGHGFLHYFSFAVGFSALGALVFLNQWSIHKWFNYYDLSHVLLTVAAILFYRGSRVIISS